MELKNTAIKGMIWSAVEQIATQGIAFILGIIIARLVLPAEYGLIAMLSIFVAIAQTFIDSGFSNAIIQKHDRSLKDYSTVFYFNIVISVLLFISLYFLSPLIAQYYDEPKLDIITKVVAFNLLISAFGVIPRAQLTVLVDFKSQTKASLFAVVISGVVGIVMAYQNWGVWALVVQGLLNNLINTVILWIYSKWFPICSFSIDSFKKLFGFGSKMLAAGLLDTVYNNLYLLVIGKKFSATELGFYARADQIARFPASNLSRVVGRVAFPIMCQVQFDDEKLKQIFKKFLKVSSFVIFPFMTGLAALAEPFIKIVFTEKWLCCVPFLQALCFYYVLFPVHGLNLTLLQAKGRTDLFLRLEIIKKVIGVLVLIVTIPFGVLAMCIGLVASSLLCMYVNIFYTNKLLHLGLIVQLKYILPSFVLSLLMGIGIYLLTLSILSSWLILLLGIIGGGAFYYYTAKFIKMEELGDIQSILSPYLPKLMAKWKNKLQ